MRIINSLNDRTFSQIHLIFLFTYSFSCCCSSLTGVAHTMRIYIKTKDEKHQISNGSKAYFLLSLQTIDIDKILRDNFQHAEENETSVGPSMKIHSVIHTRIIHCLNISCCCFRFECSSAAFSNSFVWNGKSVRADTTKKMDKLNAIVLEQIFSDDSQTRHMERGNDHRALPPGLRFN